ncbi:metallophosphoesterase family protein [Salinicoccus sesuvii]
MSTRIAIISDIHGNFNALSKVMEDMEKFGVDEIFCLGDIISMGHQTNEVLDMLCKLDNLSIIRGNHDDEVIKVLKGAPTRITGEEHNHHLWVARHLDGRFKPFLESMPLSMDKKIANYDMLLTHYHLNPDNTYCSINMSPSVEALDAIYKDKSYDMIMFGFGHDHLHYHFESSQKVFINPGALGITLSEYAPYTILEIDKESINLVHRQVPYDRNGFIEGLKQENPPALDFIMNVLLKERG